MGDDIRLKDGSVVGNSLPDANVYSGRKYGGDRSGSFYDRVLKGVDEVNQYLPTTHLLNTITYAATGNDFMGNRMGSLDAYAGVLSVIPIGKVGGAALAGVGKVVGRGGAAFFEGATYSSKVVRQMGKADDIFHAFPKSVDGFATKYGQWSTKVGADGKTYQWLKMNGSYGGKTGTFEYVRDANGIINHRFFNVPKVP